MKHAGKARLAGLKIIGASLVILLSTIAIWSYLAGSLLTGTAVVLTAFWLVFLLFTLSFFCYPEPDFPRDGKAIVSPAHGTVDVIDETTEKTFMGGRCRRISIFLSIFD